MKIKALHENFRMPQLATDGSAAFDLFMPEAGEIGPSDKYQKPIPLGFSAAIPPGHVALVMPRSGVGSKHGVELRNTVGVIDSDYRGEWFAALQTSHPDGYRWEAGDRLLQVFVLPLPKIQLMLVEQLDETERGAGGFGHTGA